MFNIVTATNRVQELLLTMDVPVLRIDDYSWLGRNLFFKNHEHPDFQEAIDLIYNINRFQKGIEVI